MNNFLQRFWLELEWMAVLLNRTLRKDQPTSYETINDNKILVPKKLQQKLIYPLVLSMPQWQGTYMLDIYACNHQPCCVLLHPQPTGPDKTIIYGLCHSTTWYAPMILYVRSFSWACGNQSCWGHIWEALNFMSAPVAASFVKNWPLHMHLVDSHAGTYSYHNFEFYVVRRASVNHQSMDPLFRIVT